MFLAQELTLYVSCIFPPSAFKFFSLPPVKIAPDPGSSTKPDLPSIHINHVWITGFEQPLEFLSSEAVEVTFASPRAVGQS